MKISIKNYGLFLLISKKEAESFTQESNANALDTTPEATPDSQLSAYNNIIEENDKNSNTNKNPNIDMNHSHYKRNS